MEPQQEFLSADEILEMDDLQVEIVRVPEWKNRLVRIRGLNGGAKNRYQDSIVQYDGLKRRVKFEHSTAKLLQLCLVDANNRPLFNEGKILQLSAKSAMVLERLAKIATRLSGMDEQDNEQTLKNSDAAQSGDSPIVSP